MSKILVLTTGVLAAGAGAILAAFKENPEGAAADVLVLEEDRKAALAVAEQSLAELAKHPTVKADPVIFSINDTNYGFNFKSMIHKGRRITVQDVLESEELQQHLVNVGSGMIRQIP